MLSKTIGLILIATNIALAACNKYLDSKPDASLAVPSSVKDLQAMLDFTSTMNFGYATIGEVFADDYFLNDTAYDALPRDVERRAYVWGKDIYAGLFPNDWSRGYDQVGVANTVLNALPSVEHTTANALLWNNVKGSALCYRAIAFYHLIQTFALAYDPVKAGSTPGIPIRMTTNFNEPTLRASQAASFGQILQDLKAAVPLLPLTPIHAMRPSRQAAYSYLARTYLCMGQYAEAGRYADSALQISNALLDYNTLNANAAYPFFQYNKEVIMQLIGNSWGELSNARCYADTNLLNSYEVNDLRKKIFFKHRFSNRYYYCNSYDGDDDIFVGPATDELYLIRAECSARNANTQAALNDLDTLLINRYTKGTYVKRVASSPADALAQVLRERRKELPFRTLRFSDLKRLNTAIAFKQTLTRKIKGNEYTLLPNDKRYAIPIPDDIIQLTGMQQN